MKILILFLLTFIHYIEGQQPLQFPNIADISNFHSKVDYRSNVNSKSAYIEEYYNFKTGRGRLDILANATQSTYIYDNATNQILLFSNNKCTVYNNLTNSSTILFNAFYNWIDRNGFLMIGPSAFLRQVQRLTQSKQINTNLMPNLSVIRRIPCRQWIVNGSAFGQNQLTFYFAVENWNKFEDVRRFKQIPVRMTIAGPQFNVDYDYFLFEPYTETWQEFLPPVGVGCFGRKSIRKLPIIGNSFSVGIEVVNNINLNYNMSNPFPLEDYIMKNNIYYDGYLDLVKVENYDSDINSKTKLIMDYSNGVSYFLENEKPCQIRHIQDSPFTKEKNAISYLKTAKELLMLSNDTYYLGKTYTRGIFCDVWERVTYTDIFNFSRFEKFGKMVITSYILDNASIDVSSEGKITDVPIQTLLTIYLPDQQTLQLQIEINFFSFQNNLYEETEIIDVFDIRDCITSLYKRSYVELFIPTTPNNVLMAQKYFKQFRLSLIESVSLSAQISPLRIPFLELDFGKTSVMANIMIIDKEQLSLSFKLVNANSHALNTEKLVAARDDDDCSLKTLQQNYRGFHWCSDKTCYINQNGTTNGNVVKPNINCSFYILDDVNISSIGLANANNLSQALSNLMYTIVRNQTKFTILMDNGRIINYMVKSYVISDQIVNDMKGNSLYNLSYPGFTLFVTEDDATIEVHASSDNNLADIGDCYRACKEKSDIDCLSFSYCRNIDNSINCYLSSQLVYEDMADKTKVKVNTQCNTYIISYLNGFTKLDGQVILSASDVNSVALTANLCAKQCSFNKQFACKSFQFCQTNECFLRRQHYLDFNVESEDVKAGANSHLTNCDFYTIKYLADYKDSGWNLIKENNPLVYYEDTAELCAKHCSYQSNNCTSFNYCPAIDDTRSKCELSTKSIYSASITTYTAQSCRHYERVNTSYTSPAGAYKINDSSSARNGLTSGAFYSLIFGLFILGAILGVIGFFSYQYYQKRNADTSGFKVKFLRDSDTES